MKKIYSIALISGTLFISACGSNNNSQNNTANNVDSAVAMSTDTAAVISYDIALIDNKKDPTCGMPTSAGQHIMTVKYWGSVQKNVKMNF